ncbi:MAG: polyhydroxyalkanoic acid system family protein [Xanthomonadales bacterium]|nr:polyhydroxyalkanoic acid system family protein [Xanthomonadales bacterium]
MSRIAIRRPHRMAPEDARRAIDGLARQIAERFAVDYAWRGNRLLFERPGVEGSIVVGEREVAVEAQLSFWLFALRPEIEREIRRYLDQALA